MADQTDIPGRLLVAIEEIERLARAVAEDVGADWVATEEGVLAIRGDEEYVVIAPLWAPLRDYIARLGPRTILGRCAAGRQIIQHFQAIETVVNDPTHRLMSPAALTALRPVINRLAEIYGLVPVEVDDECE